MKNRGKSTDHYYSSSDYNLIPCMKHPYSSSIGICAHCLRDRLTKLICSGCGEQRLSSCSCSCSEISSSYTSNSVVDVGSVGRVSFLIENDKVETPFSNPKLCFENRAAIFLNRSSSTTTHVRIKKSSNGFWRIGRLLLKMREKGCDNLGVSRSRSLCSFRGGGLMLWSEDMSSRSSSVKRSGFSEADARRRSGFDDVFRESRKGEINKNKLKESDFMDDSEFIDLKLDLSSQLKTESSEECLTVSDDRLVKKSRKSFKVWRWLFRPYNHHHHSNCEECK